MTFTLCKWEYKAIDMKSILIQERVGLFPPFVADTYQGVTTWRSAAIELLNSGLCSTQRGALNEHRQCCLGHGCVVCLTMDQEKMSVFLLCFIKKAIAALISRTQTNRSKLHSCFTLKFVQEPLGLANV